MSVEAAERAVTAAQRTLDRRIGEARALALRGKDLEAQVVELEQLEADLTEAGVLLSSLADTRQEELRRRIEVLVTHGLRTVFGQDMAFVVTTAQRGRLAATEFSIRSTNGTQTVDTPIMDARGGGVAAVAGFLLRLIVTLLTPGADPVFLLDESFAQVSAEYEGRVAEFLRELVDKTPAQVLLVTHSDAFTEHADRAYRVTNRGGATALEAL